MGKPHRRNRRLIVVLVIVGLLGAMAAGYGIRKRHIYSYYRSLRDSGIAAAKAGDSRAALLNLGRYVGRYDTDADALFYLASAQQNTPDSSGKLLLAAIGTYRRCLQLQPDRMEAWRELTSLYTKVQFHTEAADAASRVLERSPGDVPAIRARARALAGLHKYDQSLAAATEALKLDPMDLEMHLLTLQVYREANRRGEVLPYAQRVLDAHPDDPRAEVLVASACLVAEPLTEQETASLRKLMTDRYHETLPESAQSRMAAAMFLRKAAQRACPNMPTAVALVAHLDRLQLPAESIGVLDRFLERQDDPQLRRVLVHRLFLAERWADLEKHTGRLQLDKSAPDVELLGLQAIARIRSGRPAEAESIQGTLSSLSTDRSAQAWNATLTWIKRDEAAAARTAIERIRAAVAAGQDNAYLEYFLGDAYASLGERELAGKAYEQAARLNTLWSAPLVRLSRVLLDAGQRERALAAARNAASLMPRVAELGNLATVWSVVLGREGARGNADLIKLVGDIQRLAPGEPRTLPLYIVLLADSGQKQAARKAVLDAIAARPAPSESLLLRLAAISREAAVDCSDACYARAEQLYGAGPDLTLTRAQQLAAAGKAEEGAKLLEQAVKSHGGDSVAWRKAWAVYLDQVNDPRAAAAWTSLADDSSVGRDLAIQQAALRAQSVQHDRAFLLRTADRIRALTGEESVHWRLARARVVARPGAGAADLAEAGKLLGEVLAACPDHAGAQQLMAAIQDAGGKPAAAIDHLAAALKSRPDSAEVRLELSRLYQSQSDFAHAREVLEQIRPEQLEGEQANRLAALLVQVGQTAQAIAMLERPGAAKNASDRMLLVELYARRNELAKAEGLIRELLEHPTQEMIALAARFYASTGQKDKAEAALGRLGALSPKPGAKELAWGDYYATCGNGAKAVEQYASAVRSAPAHAAAWYRLISSQIRMGRIDDAMAAAVAAKRNLPADRTVSAIADLGAAAKTLAGKPALAAMAADAMRSPAEAEAARDAIRILAESVDKPAPPATVAARLQRVAERVPRLVGLHTLIIEGYLAANRTEDAVAATRAMLNASPASAEAASVAARTLAAAQQWEQSLAAAMQWRQLSAQTPIEADLLISECMLRQDRVDAASKQLEPYIATAKAQPERYLPVLWQRAKILVKLGRANEAMDLLWPAAQAADGRRVGRELAIALAGQSEAAASWLQRLAQVTPADSMDEQIDLARTWLALAERSGDRRWNQNGRAILEKVAGRPDASVSALTMYGMVATQDGNADVAEKAYRRALQIQPNLAVAQNNVAAILLEHGRDLAEAADLAAKAVRTEPNVPNYHDTLAHIQAKRGDYPAAIASMQSALRLDPGNAKWRIRLAGLYVAGGRGRDASRVLEELKTMVPDESRLPEGLRAQLSRVRLDLGAVGAASANP